MVKTLNISCKEFSRSLLSIFRVNLGCYGLLFQAFFLFLDPAFAINKPRLGLWIEVEGDNKPFENKEAFTKLKDFIDKHQFTDLFCQVYRGGRSWFPSMVADDSPFRDSLREGVNPLRELIDFAHARNIRVHGWVNVFRVAHNRNAPLISIVGKDAVLTDNYGNSLLEYSAEGYAPGLLGQYFRLETPSIWLDPTSKKLNLYLMEVIKDLLHSYPDLDGLHLDMIRYPFSHSVQDTSIFPRGLEFGYSTAAISEFAKYVEKGGILNPLETKKVEIPLNNGDAVNTDSIVDLNKYAARMPRGNFWDDWRRTRVTEFVRETSQYLKSYFPGKTLSAALIASYDRAFIYALQEWKNWLQTDLIDLALLMNYTKDSKQALFNTQTAISFTEGDKVLVGLGAWLMLHDLDVLSEQTNAAMLSGAGGIVLFSYSNLLSDRGEGVVRRAQELVNSFQHVGKNGLN